MTAHVSIYLGIASGCAVITSSTFGSTTKWGLRTYPRAR